MTIFYSDVNLLSKYSPITLHFSPATCTRILSENPAIKRVRNMGPEGGKLPHENDSDAHCLTQEVKIADLVLS